MQMKNLRMTVIAAVLALVAMVATAQNGTQPLPPLTPVVSAGPYFTASSDVIAMRYKGAWGTGSLTKESLDFIDFGKTKAQHIFVEGYELNAPNAGLSVYAGGGAYKPDLTKLLVKTNVSPDNLSIAFNAAGGVGIPSAGNSHVSFLLGAVLQYKATNALTWNAVQVQWLRFGATNSPVISSGLAYRFSK